MGSANSTSAPYQAFRTKDGWINIGAANQGNYERLVQVLDAPEIADDPRFASNPDRMRNRDALVELITEHLLRDTTENWVARLDAVGLPVGAVLDISQAVEHPQILERDMIVETRHPVTGAARSIALPIHFSETPKQVTRPAPLLGEHTREILTEYGFGEAQIGDLQREGAILPID
jgi:crotonobetainyl-CoA:carnitine CoA-transferase CaiB-like acyl-CoA transferase